MTHEKLFAGIIEILQDNHTQLTNLYEAANDVLQGEDRLAVQGLSQSLILNNRKLYNTLAAVWEVVLELVHQRETARLHGGQQIESEIVGKIQNKLDIDHDEAVIIYQYVTNQLDDYVWGDCDRDAKHALRQIACDVQQDRKDQSSANYAFDEAG